MPTGILLSDDLMFTSRVVGTGRDLGLPVTSVRTPAALLELAGREPPRCVILDLANPGLDVPNMIAELEKLSERPRVIAYGSHVDADALQAARAAGCDVVLPRSKFAAELPSALPIWLASRQEPLS